MPPLRAAAPWLVALGLTLVLVVVSAAIEPDVAPLDAVPEVPSESAETQSDPPPTPADRSSLRPYRGLGTWVDIYDDEDWRYPEVAVARMSLEGVQTLYLQTGNYRSPGKIFQPEKTTRFIEAAHASGIDVVAWYVPDFENLKRDRRRSAAAIKFQTAEGHRFDSFALDIESGIVDDLAARNRRLFRLTRQIRAIAGDMALGGIVPDPIGSLYWPEFPYGQVAEDYEVILPMGYYTLRTTGGEGVKQHVASGIAALRDQIQADDRIHYIGGLSMDASAEEVHAYREIALQRKVMGGGLYDFTDTSSTQWDLLKPFGDLRR